MVAASAAAVVAARLPNSAHAQADAAIRPFRAAVPQASIDDLRRRLATTRWPDRETVNDRSQGEQLGPLQELIAYWRAGYDWRRGEAKLNALPQFLTAVDGVEIHFIHVRSRRPDALPLIMTHGWPGSVFELLGTIGPFTDPSAHGAEADDAFHLVIPSLPGYGFSSRPTEVGWGPDRIGRAWDTLMKRLGYERYVCQGGDWGAAVAYAMGRQAPPGLLAIHVNLPATVPPEVAAVLPLGGPAPAGLSDQERTAVETLLASARMGNSAYNTMMTARPQAVGYAMSDSPVGLAAFLLVHPGFAQWEFGKNPRQSPSRDEVLDDFSLYWLTNSAASAARLYWENGGRSIISATAQMSSEVSVPVGISVFPGEVYRAPESWARRGHRNLVYFHEAERGGHFAAWEEPELFAAEVRAAFRSFRPLGKSS